MTLATDPAHSFVTVRGPLFYLFFLVALAELIIASILVWHANRDLGLAQKRRMNILDRSFLCPTSMTFWES